MFNENMNNLNKCFTSRAPFISLVPTASEIAVTSIRHKIEAASLHGCEFDILCDVK
jgi:hypothetical protein